MNIYVVYYDLLAIIRFSGVIYAGDNLALAMVAAENFDFSIYGGLSYGEVIIQTWNNGVHTDNRTARIVDNERI